MRHSMVGGNAAQINILILNLVTPSFDAGLKDDSFPAYGQPRLEEGIVLISYCRLTILSNRGWVTFNSCCAKSSMMAFWTVMEERMVTTKSGLLNWAFLPFPASRSVNAGILRMESPHHYWK